MSHPRFYRGVDGVKYSGPPDPLASAEALPEVTFQRIRFTDDGLRSDEAHSSGALLKLRRLLFKSSASSAPTQPQPRSDKEEFLLKLLDSPAKTRSESSTGIPLARAHAIGEDLGMDAQFRLDDAWLEPASSPQLDEAIGKALTKHSVRRALKALTTAVEDNLSAARKKANTSAQGKVQEAGPLEAKVELALARFFTPYRGELRQHFGVPADANGWGSCFDHGKFQVANPDRTNDEDHRPDTVVFSKRPSKRGKASVHWSDIVSVIEIKVQAAEDCGDQVTKQVLRYARCIKSAHPICSTVHIVTVCGPFVRLWTFGPGAFTTSRGYSLLKAADQRPICRTLALLVATQPSTLLGNWAPAKTFAIHLLDGSAPQTWSWTQKEGPKVIFVRPKLFGGHAVIFGGHAKLLPSSESTGQKGSGEQSTGAEAAGKTSPGKEAGSGTEQLDVQTFLKALYLLEHLKGHESRIQMAIQDVADSPTPLGAVDTAASSWPPSQRAGTATTSTGLNTVPVAPLLRDGDEQVRLHLHAFAYQHRLGERIPLSMSEVDLCGLFGQLPPTFLAYAERNVHYRDLNPTNLLYQKARECLKHIVVDHDNASLAFHRHDRGAGGSGQAARRERQRLFTAIAKDDARSADPEYLPSSVYHLGMVLEKLEEAERQRSDPQSTWKDEEAYSDALAGVQHKVDADDEHVIKLRVYAHTYVDNLESMCRVLVRLGTERSFRSHWWSDSLRSEMTHPAKKWANWTDRKLWSSFLRKFCPGMSSEWRKMLISLRHHIFEAQEARRDLLTRLLREGEGGGFQPVLEQECSLLPTDVACFEKCGELIRTFSSSVSATAFTDSNDADELG